MQIVGLTGAAGAGKDTVADYLQETEGFTQYAFAWPVKKAASEKFGVPISAFEDPEQKDQVIERWGLTPRQMAEYEGTECGREFYGFDIWIIRAEVALEMVKASTSPPQGFVVSDVRFNNEAEWIHRHGGTVIEVYRLDATSVTAHKSASGIDPGLVDTTVINRSGDLPSTFSAVDRILASASL